MSRQSTLLVENSTVQRKKFSPKNGCYTIYNLNINATLKHFENNLLIHLINYLPNILEGFFFFFFWHPELMEE